MVPGETLNMSRRRGPFSFLPTFRPHRGRLHFLMIAITTMVGAIVLAGVRNLLRTEGLAR
jgi:hypothetical protein